MSDRANERWRARARIGGRAFLARVKSIFLGTGADVDGRAAAQVVREAELSRAAGQLKGGVAKAAQLMGYLLADRSAAPARPGDDAPLAQLYSAMPALPADAIRQVVREDLGRAPEELVAEWSPEPFAAASLGQVHAARDGAGNALAVKVQYPGVAAALEDDLSSPELLRELAGALGTSLEPSAVAVLREAILSEVDYQAEGRALERFRDAFADDPEIVVPTWFPALSSRRVLTMTRLDGRPLAALREEPAVVRAAIARTLFRFGWSGPLRTGLLHADPNPGNYLVLSVDPVRVAFLDYGCVRELDAEVLAHEQRLWRSLVTRDQWNLGGELFRVALHELGLIPVLRSFDSTAYRDWERAVAAPFLTDAAGRGRPFSWTSKYAAELAALTRELLRAHLLVLPAGALLLWRQRLGLAAILGMLSPKLDFRVLLADALA